MVKSTSSYSPDSIYCSAPFILLISGKGLCGETFSHPTLAWASGASISVVILGLYSNFKSVFVPSLPLSSSNFCYLLFDQLGVIYVIPAALVQWEVSVYLGVLSVSPRIIDLCQVHSELLH